METAIVIVAVIAFIGFREWLQLQRRAMIHRERLAAVEKGMELPPLEREVGRRAWNVQRILLLAGLVWVSLGVTGFVTVTALLASSENARYEIPVGIQWIALAPIAIGLSHLVVYFVGKKKEGAAENREAR